jgi:hypothetical protein
MVNLKKQELSFAIWIQLTFKDIRGMVEHNSQLRTLVRSLAQQNEQKEQELKV